jgi:single-stranded DNA-binding protein
MNDINTVSLSGVLAGDVEMSKAKGVSVARFFIDVEGAGDQRTWGNFKVVAFDEWAEVAKKLLRGDKVVLVGALLERRGRGRREMEIRVRNLIPLPKEAPQAEIPEIQVPAKEQGSKNAAQD